MAMSQLYKIEGDFDFYATLNAPDEASYDNVCMITHLPLTLNSVTLPCKHSFNYMPLYTELCIHRNNRNIRCPYCRREFEKFMPFIPLPNVMRVMGVNGPEKKCMPAPKCQYMLKNGTHKGKACNMNGMEYDTGIFCKKHLLEEADKVVAAAAATAVAEMWTKEMDELSKSKTVVELKKMLRKKGLLVGGTKKELIKRLLSQ